MNDDNKAEPTVTHSATDIHWSELIPKLPLSGMVRALADNCSVQSWDGVQVTLLLEPKHAPLYNATQEKRLTEALSQHFEKPIKVAVTIAEHKNATPAAQAQRQRDEKQRQAEQVLGKDVNVQAILDKFNAKIAPGSVKSEN